MLSNLIKAFQTSQYQLPRRFPRRSPQEVPQKVLPQISVPQEAPQQVVVYSPTTFTQPKSNPITFPIEVIVNICNNFSIYSEEDYKTFCNLLKTFDKLPANDIYKKVMTDMYILEIQLLKKYFDNLNCPEVVKQYKIHEILDNVINTYTNDIPIENDNYSKLIFIFEKRKSVDIVLKSSTYGYYWISVVTLSLSSDEKDIWISFVDEESINEEWALIHNYMITPFDKLTDFARLYLGKRYKNRYRDEDYDYAYIHKFIIDYLD